MRLAAPVLLLLAFASLAHAAPDEDKLGKAFGFVIGTGGAPSMLKAPPRPMALPRAAHEPDIRA
jgi:hypothetical protein